MYLCNAQDTVSIWSLLEHILNFEEWALFIKSIFSYLKKKNSSRHEG